MILKIGRNWLSDQCGKAVSEGHVRMRHINTVHLLAKPLLP